MSDTRKAFEAWIAKDCGDLSTFGSGKNMHYLNSAVNNAWSGWQEAARQAAPQDVRATLEASREATKEHEEMNAVFGFLRVVVAVALGSVWSGYALSVLWGWFVVPTFGAPSLGIANAIGVGLIASFLTHQHNGNRQEFGEALATAVISPAIALAIGWIVRQFM